MGQEDSMLMMQEQTVSSSPNAFFQDHYHGGVHGAKGSEVKNNGVPVGTGNVLATHNAAEQQSSIITPSTQMSPSMYRQGPDAYKSLPSGMVPARGPRTRFFDPLTLMYSAGYRERRFSVSFDALRAIVKQVPIIASIITTRVNQVAAFAQPYRENKQVGFQIRFKDDGHQPSDEEKEQIRRLEQMIMACGFGPNPYSPYPRDDFETFLRKFTTDSLTLDQACAEITPDTYGRPYEFRAVDAATIRLAATFEGFRGSGPNRLQREQFTDGFQERWKKVYGEEFGGMTSDQVFSIQLLHGRIENIFSYNDLAFCVRNPETNIWNNGYGTSELEKALNAVLGMLWGEIYNRAFFKQGCVGEDTRVFTDEGVFYIKDLPVNPDVEFSPIGNVWNGSRWVPFDVVSTGQKETIRTTLDDGFEIHTSPDHKFLALTDSGEILMRPIAEIQEGDFVARSLEVAPIELPESLIYIRNKNIPKPLLKRMAKHLEEHCDISSLFFEERTLLLKLANFADDSSQELCSRDEIIEICQKLDCWDFLEELSYQWIRVSSIEDMEEMRPMYDVRIKDSSHQWSCGGVILSNSAPKGLINIKGDEISEAQMESFRRAWYAMIAGVENCLHGDTTIWTREEGMVSLENYIEGTEEKEATIWTGKEWASGLVYRTKEQKQLCRLKLACGLEIKSSPDHKFRVLGGGDGLPVWKRLEDLQEGDYVLVNKQSPQNPDNIPHCNGKQVTPDLMEVLGWAVGDGYFSDKGMLCFYHHEKEREIRERHLSILKDFDPAARLKDIHITPEEQEKIKERYGFKSVASERLQIVLNNVNFARWLKEVGFQFSSEGKNVPPFVYTLPNELKFAFLRGLFSADGHIGDGRFVAITITNDSLRQEVKWLLSSVGIRTNLSEGKQKIVIDGPLRYYEEKESLLRIKDKDYFYENIGFLQDHKQPDDLVNPNEANKHSRVSPRTTYFFARKIQKKNKEANYELLTLRERLDLNAIIRGDDGCSLPRILRFLEKVNITPPNWLLEYHFSPISEIEITTDFVDMFDVSINTDLHAFAANGIVISNSFRTPILQAEQMEYIDLQHTNREMEFQSWLEYLIRQVCASYLIDPSEVGFDLTSGGGSGGAPVFESKHEWKIKHSRDKGLRPLLRFISKQITKYIVDPLDSRLYFDFVGLDELSERERVELLNMKMSAFMTLNEGRASEGLPPRPDGNVILNPAWIQARTLLEEEGQMLPDPSEEQMAYMTAGENEIPGYGQAKPVPLYMQTNPDRNKIPPLGGVPDPNDPNQM